jgi:hypothetical protein
MYLPRDSAKTLERYLSAFPAVGVTGPRQSGKSTLLQHALPNYEYVTFDQQKNVSRFEDDPEGFLNNHSNRVIFDEVQYVPQLFNAVKVIIDQNRSDYGRFVLTGSSQFSFLRNISESLAGRIGLMSLLPLQYSEAPEALQQESIYQGSYPELVTRAYHAADLWHQSYLDTYLTKDVRLIAQIGDMRDFRRLIQLLAANTAQILDMSYYARQIGVSVTTIKRWVSILEASYIIFLLPPYHNNFGKRISKRAKLYFCDTGLVSHLTSITNYDLYDNGPMAGALFENYVVLEILKKLKHNGKLAELYYLRTQDKAEIDLIVDWGQHSDFIEIKKTASYKPKMAAQLKKYASDKDRKIVLYNGKADQHGDIEILPYGDYLKEKT